MIPLTFVDAITVAGFIAGAGALIYLPLRYAWKIAIEPDYRTLQLNAWKSVFSWIWRRGSKESSDRERRREAPTPYDMWGITHHGYATLPSQTDLPQISLKNLPPYHDLPSSSKVDYRAPSTNMPMRNPVQCSPGLENGSHFSRTAPALPCSAFISSPLKLGATGLEDHRNQQRWIFYRPACHEHPSVPVPDIVYSSPRNARTISNPTKI